jgi:hypothetical protein
MGLTGSFFCTELFWCSRQRICSCAGTE